MGGGFNLFLGVQVLGDITIGSICRLSTDMDNAMISPQYQMVFVAFIDFNFHFLIHFFPKWVLCANVIEPETLSGMY